jgi:hypothetical protein
VKIAGGCGSGGSWSRGTQKSAEHHVNSFFAEYFQEKRGNCNRTRLLHIADRLNAIFPGMNLDDVTIEVDYNYLCSLISMNRLPSQRDLLLFRTETVRWTLNGYDCINVTVEAGTQMS